MAKRRSEKAWEKLIRKKCEDIGTYKPEFDLVISDLAAVLVERDRVYDAYVEDGGRPYILYTNKAGAENMNKNPLLVQWNDFNATALAYWRDLGLTPAALRKITGDSGQKPDKPSGLAAALMSLEQ